MEFTIVKDSFVEPVNRLTSVTSAKSYNLSNMNILIKGYDDHIKMMSINSDALLMINYKATVKDRGSIS